MSKQNIQFGELETRALFALEESDKGLIKTHELANLLNISDNQAKKLAWQLVKKNRLLRLRRGIYLFAPFKAGPEGYWTDTGVTLASELLKDKPHYVSFWTALNFYSFTEQVPQVTQVVTTHAQPSFEGNGIRFEFVKVRKLGEWREDTIGGKKFHIATKEQLLIDCMTIPKYCGGMDEVSKAIHQARKEVNWKKVKSMAMKSKDVVRRRLGYLLDLYKLPSNGLEKKTVGFRWLDPIGTKEAYATSTKWGLRLNRTEKQLTDWMLS